MGKFLPLIVCPFTAAWWGPPYQHAITMCPNPLPRFSCPSVFDMYEGAPMLTVRRAVFLYYIYIFLLSVHSAFP